MNMHFIDTLRIYITNSIKQKLLHVKISLLVITLFIISCLIIFNTISFSVYGHSIPTFYIPKPNQLYDKVNSEPNEILINFTERPELQASKIYVLNYKNERVDNHDLTLGQSQKSLLVTLDKSKLIPGLFTVKWMVLSKDDGFITRGSYTFSIA